MTAFQTMMLSAQGAPEMPPGGSDWSRLKSRTAVAREAWSVHGARKRQRRSRCRCERERLNDETAHRDDDEKR